MSDQSQSAPFFSLVIPVHNRPELLQQTIDSVLGQSHPDREIIVVDDASDDGTPAVLRAYGDRIRVVTLPESRGCEVARNEGAAVARGVYLAFLDSDDLLFPWALATYDFVLRATGRPALLVSRIAYFNTEPPAAAGQPPGPTVDLVEFPDYLSRDRSIGSTASMIVVRRDVFTHVEGFRSSTAKTFNMSDHDFLMRVGCASPAIYLENPQTVAYRVHPGNSIRNLRRVAEGILRLVAAERRGAYPGGTGRKFDRYASIGGPLAFWGLQALKHGEPRLGLRVLLTGCPMILAKAWKRIATQAKGLRPMTTLLRPEVR